MEEKVSKMYDFEGNEIQVKEKTITINTDNGPITEVINTTMDDKSIIIKSSSVLGELICKAIKKEFGK